MEEDQALDDEVTASKTAITGLQLREITLSTGNTPLLCDVSTGAERPLVPVRWRRRVFDAIHGLSHPSIRSTCKLIATKFVWHGLAKQVRDWAKACIPCQRSKIHRHTKTPLARIPEPQSRFDHIHVDLVGPLPPSQGFTHLFTIVDRFTRWPEAIPLTSTDTKSCARVLLSHWIARFGLPQHLSLIHI